MALWRGRFPAYRSGRCGCRVTAYGGVMEVRLFGELEALDGGVPVPVRGAKQRALLALLALQGGSRSAPTG